LHRDHTASALVRYHLGSTPRLPLLEVDSVSPVCVAPNIFSDGSSSSVIPHARWSTLSGAGGVFLSRLMSDITPAEYMFL
jgi:hypothetical protein